MFIAEVGINHNGSIDTVFDIVSAAAEAGADVVKFQKRSPDICVPEYQKQIQRKTPWGTMSYIDYKHRIEFSKYEYDYIDELASQYDIKWTASVFDIESLEFIMNYNVPFIKVASSSITNTALLEEITNYTVPVVMSTGMSTIGEIQSAVDILEDNIQCIMHCTSSYPTYDNDINLNCILTLKQRFPDYDIGYSGHEIGIMPTIIAATKGATWFERHVTCDKRMWGTDQSMSLEPNELYTLIETLNNIPAWEGSDDIQILECELESRKKLRV